MPVAAADVRALARLLADAVEAGAAESFLAPLGIDRAEAWWRGVLRDAHPRAVFLVARDGGQIVRTVQIQPAWAPNQPHRAEIAKLLSVCDPFTSWTGGGAARASARGSCARPRTRRARRASGS